MTDTHENKSDISDLRTRIDELDKRLVNLINERAEIAHQIGSIKSIGKNYSTGLPVYVPARERDVYERVLACNKGPMPDKAIRAVYREIMSGSIALERPTRIGFLGPAGSYSDLAVRARFGSSVEGLPQHTIRDVFLAVARNHADYGLVPIENSSEGGVNATQDCLMDSKLKIYSEVLLPIHHNLMSLEEAEGKPERIYSIPQVLGQCRDWLNANFADVPLVETASSTAAAQKAAQDPAAAALASSAAAEIYGLSIREANIEDQPDNLTRFVVLSLASNIRTGNDKTTIFFSIKDKIGATAAIMAIFAKYSINLTWIQSRPSKKKAWDYIFWADFLGHCEDENVIAALGEAREECHQLEVCGSFPVARFEASD